MKVVAEIKRMGIGYGWTVFYEDGTRPQLFVAQENGWESNKRKAQKAADHSVRLTQQAVDRLSK